MNLFDITNNVLYPFVMTYMRDILTTKIAAIKLDRIISGRGLKDSKDYVESLPSYHSLTCAPMVPDWINHDSVVWFMDHLQNLARIKSMSSENVEYANNRADSLRGSLDIAREHAEAYRLAMNSADQRFDELTVQFNELSAKYNRAMVKFAETMLGFNNNTQ